jgi:cytochrome c oxidase subunit IV
MSTTDTPETEAVDASHAHHPTPADYVRIAIILAVLTALEVSTYFFDFGVVGIPLLIVLMIIKFVYVASWFMHLRFDSRLYGRFLYGGLTLAVVLYAATLSIILFLSADFV